MPIDLREDLNNINKKLAVTIVGLAGLLLPLSIVFMPWKEFAIWSFALVQLLGFLTSIYLHRGLAHRSLTFSPPLAFAMRFILWLFSGIMPKQWVAVHRKHHAFTDVEGDPHSPVVEGYFAIMFDFAAHYTREAAKPDTVEKYARDIPVYRLDRHRNLWTPLSIALISVLHFLISGGLFVSVLFGTVVVLASALGYIFLGATINALTHVWGRKNYKKQPAFNVWSIALLTAGEALHNNHHATPGSPKLAHKWWEIDPSWIVIKMLSAAKLLKVRSKRPH